MFVHFNDDDIYIEKNIIMNVEGKNVMFNYVETWEFYMSVKLKTGHVYGV